MSEGAERSDAAGPGEESGRPWRRRARRALGLGAVGLRLTARFAAVLAKFALVAALLAGAALAEPERRARARRWFLLEGNRWVIASGITGVVFVGTLALSVTRVVGVSQAAFVTTMFSDVISGLFSLVPIVITVNQLTVSRVVGSVSDIREQLESARAFKRDVGALSEDCDVAPNEPARFLDTVASALADRAGDLSESVRDRSEAASDAEDGLRAEVDDLVSVLRAQTDEIAARIEGDRSTLLTLLLPMMGDNYPENVADARRIERRSEGALPGAAAEALADVRELSTVLDLLRQYYKAMYVQQELSRLSRYVGYTGVLSFVVAILVVMSFAAGQPFPGWPLLLDVAVSLAIATVVLPFAILLSFVIRIATIAQRTAAPGPFTPLRETPAYARHRE